MLSVINAECHM